MTIEGEVMRVSVKAVSLVLVLPLALSACGGSNAGAVREKTIADMTTSLTAAGAPQSAIDCMAGVVNGLSDDDVVNLDKGSASQEVQDAFTAATTACAPAVKGWGNPRTAG